jgi:hypothetical protein
MLHTDFKDSGDYRPINVGFFVEDLLKLGFESPPCESKLLSSIIGGEPAPLIVSEPS